MDIYLAATAGLKKYFMSGEIDPEGLFLLESYVSIKEWQLALLPKLGGFLLDSGAFTFMQNAKKHGEIKWDRYADEYADFVRNNKIKKYMELDIDAIVGLRNVECLRQRIEARVGWQCIPVWHTERGKDYFEAMCRDYPYVALGSIAKVVPPKIAIPHKYFPWFIETAHKNGAKLHALGYTKVSELPNYRFDSVDSTTWISTTQYGKLQIFNGTTIETHSSHDKSGIKIRNLKDPSAAHILSFNEWVKFQKYAQINL